MQMLCIRTAVDEVVHLEQVFRDLPPLADIFESWHSSRSRVSMNTLKLREQCLGVATLSSASLCLLYDIASQYLDDLHLRVCTHEASQSALETQALLPQHVLVQKTVTMDMARNLLLWSCVGEQEYAMMRGMVSPFLPPYRPIVWQKWSWFPGPLSGRIGACKLAFPSRFSRA